MGRGVVVAVVGACLLAGCGDATGGDPPRNTPALAARHFFAAALHEHDYGTACRFTARGFYLRPTRVAGVNVGPDDPGGPPLHLRLTPRRGPCPVLARRVAVAFDRRLPGFAFWHTEGLYRRGSGGGVEVATNAGTAGVVRAGPVWRVLWVDDPA